MKNPIIVLTMQTNSKIRIMADKIVDYYKSGTVTKLFCVGYTDSVSVTETPEIIDSMIISAYGN